MLEFDSKELFNSNGLQEYNEDGQKGFLGFLIRYKEWDIINNKIVFPTINSKEEEKKNVIEYNKYSLMTDLRSKKNILDEVLIRGEAETCYESIKKRLNELEKQEEEVKQKKYQR